MQSTTKGNNFAQRKSLKDKMNELKGNKCSSPLQRTGLWERPQKARSPRRNEATFLLTHLFKKSIGNIAAGTQPQIRQSEYSLLKNLPYLTEGHCLPDCWYKDNRGYKGSLWCTSTEKMTIVSGAFSRSAKCISALLKAKKRARGTFATLIVTTWNWYTTS